MHEEDSNFTPQTYINTYIFAPVNKNLILINTHSPKLLVFEKSYLR